MWLVQVPAPQDTNTGARGNRRRENVIAPSPANRPTMSRNAIFRRINSWGLRASAHDFCRVATCFRLLQSRPASSFCAATWSSISSTVVREQDSANTRLPQVLLKPLRRDSLVSRTCGHLVLRRSSCSWIDHLHHIHHRTDPLHNAYATHSSRAIQARAELHHRWLNVRDAMVLLC